MFASPEPEDAVAAIGENLEAALEQFREIAGDLTPNKPKTEILESISDPVFR
jgi:hypothetical protein